VVLSDLKVEKLHFLISYQSPAASLAQIRRREEIKGPHAKKKISLIHNKIFQQLSLEEKQDFYTPRFESGQKCSFQNLNLT
jgi:hypothetical protein